MRYSIYLGILSGSSAYAVQQTSYRAGCGYSNKPGMSGAFRYLGRVNPATNELTWPGSGISFVFNGTAADVPITFLVGTNSLEVVVDGGAPIITNNVSGSSIPVRGLNFGQHTVEIRKKSEALFGSIFIGSPTTSGTITTSTTQNKYIEIIGDSISVGYGLDAQYPCTNSAGVENAELTYGALTAKNLSADYSIVAWSGRGLTRNYVTSSVDTRPLMPELWSRYGANDADNSFDFKTSVDVVIINLGTNDFSYVLSDSSGTARNVRSELNETTYTSALVSFSRTVLAKYSSAELFITSSPMLTNSTEEAQHAKQETCIQNAIAQIGAKAHFVSFPSQDQTKDNIGCDYHPSSLTHQRMAVALTAAISSVLIS